MVKAGRHRVAVGHGYSFLKKRVGVCQDYTRGGGSSTGLVLQGLSGRGCAPRAWREELTTLALRGPAGSHRFRLAPWFVLSSTTNSFSVDSSP